MSERFEDIFFVVSALIFMIGGAIGYFIADYKISNYREEMKIVCKELKDNSELYKRLKSCEKYVEKE
ncbi:MAG: hypothetical protein N2505_05390 [Endomicrobia bacterium]|nr:hypothetical protein [Endomicrobiia bacterium]